MKIIKWKNCISIYQENKDEIEHTIFNANALSLKTKSSQKESVLAHTTFKQYKNDASVNAWLRID